MSETSKTPLQEFRNSVNSQFNFVFYSDLEIELALNNICDIAVKFAEASQPQNTELLSALESILDALNRENAFDLKIAVEVGKNLVEKMK